MKKLTNRDIIEIANVKLMNGYSQNRVIDWVNVRSGCTPNFLHLQGDDDFVKEIKEGDGEKYIGEFVNNEFNGLGLMTYVYGKSMIGDPIFHLNSKCSNFFYFIFMINPYSNIFSV